jgi:hypothetical protein
MVAKKYAISAPSAAIALRYGANVSRGIQAIEKRTDTERERVLDEIWEWVETEVVCKKPDPVLEQLVKKILKMRKQHPSGPSVRKLK